MEFYGHSCYVGVSIRGVNENQVQNIRTQKFIFEVGQRFAEGSFQLLRTG